MAQDLTGFNAVLKDTYADKVRYALTDKRYLLEQLEKKTDGFDGEQFIFPVHVGRSSGVGFRGEGGTYPPAGAQQYTRGFVKPRKCCLKVQVTGEVDVQSRHSRGAFIRAMSSEMERITQDAKELMNLELYNDGSGIHSLVASTTGAPSTTVNVKGYLNWKDGNHAALPNGTHALGRRQKYGVGTQPNFNSVGTFEVGTVNSITKGASFVSDAAVTVAVDEIVGSAHAANALEHGVGKSIQGFLAAISDQDAWNVASGRGWGYLDVSGLVDPNNMLVRYNGYCNILRSAFPEWKSEVLDAGGDLRPISEDLFEDAIGRIQQHSDLDPKDLAIIMHQSLFKKWVKLFKQDRRFVNTTEFKGGYKFASFEFGGEEVKIIVDRYAPYHTAIGLHEPSAQWFVAQDWEWEETGGGIIKSSENGDYYYAKMKAYKEFAVMEPYKCFLIRDLEADESSFGQ